MNAVQNEVLRFITTNIHEQIMNGSTQRLRLFVTGNAGTREKKTWHVTFSKEPG